MRTVVIDCNWNDEQKDDEDRIAKNTEEIGSYSVAFFYMIVDFTLDRNSRNVSDWILLVHDATLCLIHN